MSGPGPTRPAFYASRTGGWRDYWTLLHPPYTAWHLSYVAIGAASAPALDPARLGLTLVAFFLAVGVAAHALDEHHDRPLGTQIPAGILAGLAVAGMAGALAIGLYGAWRYSWWGLVFIAIGGFLVPAYNLEWFRGRFHSDLWFAVMWGGFPALAGSFAQILRIDVVTLLVATGCAFLSVAQRRLSTPVRKLRRHVTHVTGKVTLRDGSTEPLDEEVLREAPEGALRVLWFAMVVLAVGLVVARWP